MRPPPPPSERGKTASSATGSSSRLPTSGGRRIAVVVGALTLLMACALPQAGVWTTYVGPAAAQNKDVVQTPCQNCQSLWMEDYAAACKGIDPYCVRPSVLETPHNASSRSGRFKWLWPAHFILGKGRKALCAWKEGTKPKISLYNVRAVSAMTFVEYLAATRSNLPRGTTTTLTLSMSIVTVRAVKDDDADQAAHLPEGKDQEDVIERVRQRGDTPRMQRVFQPIKNGLNAAKCKLRPSWCSDEDEPDPKHRRVDAGHEDGAAATATVSGGVPNGGVIILDANGGQHETVSASNGAMPMVVEATGVQHATTTSCTDDPVAILSDWDKYPIFKDYFQQFLAEDYQVRRGKFTVEKVWRASFEDSQLVELCKGAERGSRVGSTPRGWRRAAFPHPLPPLLLLPQSHHITIAH